jgi:hypothetical protein
VQELASAVELHASASLPAQWFADALLERAIEAEQGRPGDDISVLVVAILPAVQPMELPEAKIRRMSVHYPIQIRGIGTQNAKDA